MGDIDLHLFSEGNHLQIYEKFGAHLRKIGGVDGRLLCGLGAECAAGQRGRRLQWMGSAGPIRCVIWSAAGCGNYSCPVWAKARTTSFKSERRVARLLLKSDPFAFFNQHGVRTSSLVYNLDRYQWNDSAWMEARPSPIVADQSAQHLRGSSRFMAAEARGKQSFAQLPRTGGHAAALRDRDGLHPHRTDAGCRASV